MYNVYGYIYNIYMCVCAWDRGNGRKSWEVKELFFISFRLVRFGFWFWLFFVVVAAAAAIAVYFPFWMQHLFSYFVSDEFRVPVWERVYFFLNNFLAFLCITPYRASRVSDGERNASITACPNSISDNLNRLINIAIQSYHYIDGTTNLVRLRHLGGGLRY